jgi:hypothetical protein
MGGGGTSTRTRLELPLETLGIEGGGGRKPTEEQLTQFRKTFKDVPGLIGRIFNPRREPEPPREDAAAEERKRRALIARIQAAAFTGPGRAATIATSPLGVRGEANIRRRTLTPTQRNVRRRIAT